ncbi:conserved hypothetical protein [Coccidioides posadasii str. Silveira]|uniref:Uncharacterized protein n=1 Tax=Coccidioides posadasii (strain RMSCC 757 / Silveira) TaxID=443226 RepID=E9DAL0_COCPS|nr:conserved hypothetical protein [Coccidioides posadasii str. Silveira]
MILCLMLRFAFLHLSRWLHHSIGNWGHNQKTALLIPLQQRWPILNHVDIFIEEHILQGLDILHKTTKSPPSALFAFHFFAGRSSPRADGCGGPNKLVDWLNEASSPLPRAREKRNKKDDDGRLGTIPPKRTQSDFPQDPVNASLRTWKHSRPEQLLLTRLSGCDSAFPTSPKGVGWILVFEEEKSQPNKTVPGFPSVFSRRRICEYINSTSGHPSPCVTSASVLETRSPGAAWQYHKRSSLCQPITKSMLSGSNSSLERQPKFPSVELPPDPSQPHVNVALSIRH